MVFFVSHLNLLVLCKGLNYSLFNSLHDVENVGAAGLDSKKSRPMHGRLFMQQRTASFCAAVSDAAVLETTRICFVVTHRLGITKTFGLHGRSGNA